MSNSERQSAEKKIANDLNTIDLIMAIGGKSQKRKAQKQKKICFDQIKKWNAEDGVDAMSDDELLAALNA